MERQPHTNVITSSRRLTRNGKPVGRPPVPIERRFWPKVAKAGPDDCWLWTGAKVPDGYGNISRLGAHRVSWEIAHGPIPDGLWVLHRCDVRACVNPAHLFLGTAGDNTRDMWSKGRGVGRRGWRSDATACPHGHPYDEANTGLYHGLRYCRQCKRERCRMDYYRRKAS